MNKACVPVSLFIVYFLYTLARPHLYFPRRENLGGFFFPNKLAHPVGPGSPPIFAAQIFVVVVLLSLMLVLFWMPHVV
jgi:hypothetical protein